MSGGVERGLATAPYPDLRWESDAAEVARYVSTTLMGMKSRKLLDRGQPGIEIVEDVGEILDAN
jgi:hypothetical protein